MELETAELAQYKELMENPTDENLSQVLELMMEQCFAERGCLWLEDGNRIIYHGDEQLRERFPFSTQIVNRAVETGRGFVSFDSQADERLEPEGSVIANDIRSCLCAASRDAEGKVLAVAYFDNKISAGNFNEKDLDLLAGIMALYPGAAPTPA